MPNPVWHASLPQSQFLGTALGFPADTVVRFAVDAGPAKTRPRYTSASRALTVPIVLTNAQMIVLDTFYRTTLKMGALEFDWVDPTTNTAVAMRFVAPPQLNVRANAPDGRRWEGQLAFEILP